MESNATLNIRLPKTLKEHGSQILNYNGISTSQAVRKLFEYMEREQKIPDCIASSNPEDKYEQRRELIKSFAGCATPLPKGWTMNDIKNERLARLIDEGRS